MALGDLWNRTLVYFGIAEEDDDWEDEDGYAAEESLEQSYRERPNVRRLTPRRRGAGLRRLDRVRIRRRRARGRAPPRARPGVARARPAAAPHRGGPEPGSVRVHLVLPRSFNDAQQIADRFKQGSR